MSCRRSKCRQTFFAAVFLLAVLFLSQAPAGASAYNDWTGTWSTNRGDLILGWTKEGGISGAYGQNGRIEAKPADPWAKVIRGTWSEGKVSGPLEFRMDDGMKGFQGWRNSPGNCWQGTRDVVPEPTD